MSKAAQSPYSSIRNLVGAIQDGYHAVKASLNRRRGNRSQQTLAASMNVAGTSGFPYGQSVETMEQVRKFRLWNYISIKCIAEEWARQQVSVGFRRKPNEVTKDMRQKMLPDHYRRKSFVSMQAHEEIELADSDHPLAQLLANPNEPETAFSFFYRLAMFLELAGRCYLWMVPNRLGDVLELWHLFPQWVTVQPGSQRLVDKYIVRPQGYGYSGGQQFDLDADDVIPILYPSPLSMIMGHSPTQACAEWTDVGEAIDASRWYMFDNGSRPDMVVETDYLAFGKEPFNKPQLDAFYSQFENRLRGRENHGKPIVLHPGMKAQPWKKSAVEMDYNESAEQSSRWQMAIRRVSRTIAGIEEDETYACHDSETELLTKRGWHRYQDLVYGDEAGTMNPETREFEWQEIQAIHVANYDGDMIRLKSHQNFDALVTPNHRMLRANYKFARPVNDVLYKRNKLDDWQFVLADQLESGVALPLTCGPKRGVPQECLIVPGVLLRHKHKAAYRLAPDRTFPMSGFLAFLGWWVAEGWTVNRTPSGRGHAIGVSQKSASVHECTAIRESAKSLTVGGLNVGEFDQRDGMTKWQINDKSLWTWLRAFCGEGSYSKRLPQFVNDLPAIQQREILDSLILGDGSHRESGSFNFYSVSKTLIDQVQSLSIQCGLIAHVSDKMDGAKQTVRIRPTSDRAEVLPNHLSRVEYRGIVWCVTVPNGLIVTRRNGKALVSGNSSVTHTANFINRTMGPKYSLAGGVFTEKLAPRFDDNAIIFWQDSPPTDPEQLNKDITTDMACGARTPNEIRKLRGLEPYPHGGDNPMIGGVEMPWVAEDVQMPQDWTQADENRQQSEADRASEQESKQKLKSNGHHSLLVNRL